jgi:hypothetical protein
VVRSFFEAAEKLCRPGESMMASRKMGLTKMGLADKGRGG